MPQLQLTLADAEEALASALRSPDTESAREIWFAPTDGGVAASRNTPTPIRDLWKLRERG